MGEEKRELPATTDNDEVQAAPIARVPQQKIQPPTLTNNQMPASVIESAHRAAAETYSRVLVAQQCPRNEAAFEKEMVAICDDPYFAEQAIYSVKIGSDYKEGPSIHLANEMAARFKNFEWKVIDHGVANGENQYECWAWDIQNNSRKTEVQVISVPDWAKSDMQRTRYSGGFKSKTMRGVIFHMMPKGTLRQCIDAALARCDKIADENHKNKVTFLNDLKNRFGITTGDLCAFVGQKSPDDLTPADVRRLMALRQSFIQGELQVTDVFKNAKPTAEAKALVEASQPRQRQPATPKPVAGAPTIQVTTPASTVTIQTDSAVIVEPSGDQLEPEATPPSAEPEPQPQPQAEVEPEEPTPEVKAPVRKRKAFADE